MHALIDRFSDVSLVKVTAYGVVVCRITASIRTIAVQRVLANGRVCLLAVVVRLATLPIITAEMTSHLMAAVMAVKGLAMALGINGSYKIARRKLEAHLQGDCPCAGSSKVERSSASHKKSIITGVKFLY